jgi:ATP-binding cassette, subfamily B, bacterial
MAFGGPPVGGPFGLPGGAQASAAAGLPFAGIPTELAERAEGILAQEPAHPPPRVEFHAIPPHGGRFTLWGFLRPHRLALAGAAVLVVVETLALLAGPLLTRIGIDDGVLAGDAAVLAGVAAAYLGAVALSVAAGAARIAVTARLGERLTHRLRLEVFAHLNRLGLDVFGEERQGRLLARMTSDVEAISVLFQDGLVNLGVQGLTLVAVTVVLFVLDPFLAAVTLLVVVPAMAALTLWFRSASDRTYGRVRDRIADVLADLSENLAGIRVVTALGRRRQNAVLHANLVGDLRDANVAATRVGSIYGPASEWVGVVGQAVVVAVGGWMVQRGRLTVGELFAFLLYLATFFAPIQQLVQLYTTYQQGRAAAQKLAELFALEPHPAERPGAATLPPISGHIRLEGVRFGYDPDRPVLDGVDLDVPAGQVVAVVGPTGAGKSTIAKLVTRSYDPQAGTVRIDGWDLRDVTLASLRSQLGVVPQEPYLFGGSLRDNIAFARPEASEEEVAEAVEAVGLGGLVARLPRGVEESVHERGVSLSAGERQLVALARAFLARPRVLVLDEATSNLDLASEQVVEAALDRLLEGRTAVIIAHRLATALRADRIVVVDGGRIVESGPHDELLRRGGRYASMHAAWSAQAPGPAHP